MKVQRFPVRPWWKNRSCHLPFSGSHIAGKIRIVHDTIDGSFSGLNGNVFVGQILNGDFQPFAHPAFFVSAGVGDSDSAVLEQYL